MKFVFWQNVISIHQSAFIRALSDNNDVTLVVEKALAKERTKEGWDVPDMGNARILISPDINIIETLLDDKDARHVFSGIDSIPLVYETLKKAVKKGLSFSVMAEPYNYLGFKGKIRTLKYRILYFLYGKHINHLFTTGLQGEKYYRLSGFPKSKIFQWGYFTEHPLETSREVMSHDLPSILFIGKIDHRKNILPLINEVKKLAPLYSRFYIIGKGPLELQLKDAIADSEKIEFIGGVANSEIHSFLQNSDILILPSIFDGWGAVVNEALMNGTRVLCSDRCGATSLLDNMSRGTSFSLKGENLHNTLKFWLEKGTISNKDRELIKNWAINHISGKVVADYFESVFYSPNNKIAPWLK